MPVAGPAYYLINLDRSPERLAAVRQCFDALGLGFTRISAFDGRAMTDCEFNAVYSGRYSLDGGLYLDKTQVAIALSHCAALNAFMASRHEYAVVLEDDAVVGPGSVAVIDYLIRQHRRQILDFDCVELSGKRKRDVPRRTLAEYGDYRIVCPKKTTPVAAATLYTRKGMTRILARALPVTTHWDNYLSLYFHHGARFLSVRPYPVPVARVDSTYRAGEGLRPARRVDHLKRRLYRAYQGPYRFLADLGWYGM